MIEIISWCVVVLQFGSVPANLLMYLKLFHNLKKSKMKLENQKTKKGSHVSILVQVIVVISSFVITWIPSGIINLTLLYTDSYPIDLLIWVIVGITPITPVVNAVVFIIIKVRK